MASAAVSLQQKAAARKRLMRDWKELQGSPVLGIAAAPLPHDLFQFHATMQASGGPYAGLVLHMILKFPTSYPADPPQVELCTPIPHSNVIPQKGVYTCASVT